MAQSIPTQHTAGDSFAAVLSDSAASAADGWAAQLVLIGPDRITLNSTASGADHAIAAAATVTADWAPGTYTLRALYTKASDRISRDAGTLRVLPDPAAIGTHAGVLKSPAQQAYDSLQAAYRAYLASGRFTVQSYTIAGRSTTYRSVAELLQALNAAARDVEAERAAAAIAAGASPRGRFVVRM